MKKKKAKKMIAIDSFGIIKVSEEELKKYEHARHSISLIFDGVTKYLNQLGIRLNLRSETTIGGHTYYHVDRIICDGRIRINKRSQRKDIETVLESALYKTKKLQEGLHYELRARLYRGPKSSTIIGELKNSLRNRSKIDYSD